MSHATRDRARELRRESAVLAERLAHCLPGATFEMETLVRLAGVEASDDVRTAAVTCEDRPRLLLNPDFVAERCASDEHLFLLAMHELWHVILAHTRLYPRATPAQNIAFDAVINAGLIRQFPGPEYRSFFESLNSAHEFPALLLRPPTGWPRAPRRPKAGPPGTAALLGRLYPKQGQQRVAMPFYREILELIEKAAQSQAEEEQQKESAPADQRDPEEPATSRPGGGPQGAPREPFLLGDHGDGPGEEGALEDDLFGDVVRQIVAAWPPPPLPLAGRDAGRNASDWITRPEAPPPHARAVFARVLRRVLGPRPGRHVRRQRALAATPSGRAPLPNPFDRTVHARRALGLPALLQEQIAPRVVRVPHVPSCAHVYVDVSGSMLQLLPRIAGLLVPYVKSGQARCFQFSNEVFPLAAGALQSGKLHSTGGTDIDCVIAHWLQVPRVRRALVLTDGYVGQPNGSLARHLEQHRLQLHVVLSHSGWARDLEAIAASITLLPELRDA